jgi:uncharacterized RDD family membrane protein YckC
LPDYAGFWARALAFLLDAVIVTVIVVPILVLGFGVQEIPTENSWELLVFLATAAAVIAFWRAFGATPGKIALGLKIVDAASGARPSLGRLALRFLGYFVSAFPLYLGFLWAALDRRKQGWHDKIARTIVINSEE